VQTIIIKNGKQLQAIADAISGADTTVIDATLKAGAKAAEGELRARLYNSLSGNSTGELVGAFGTSPAKTSSKNSDRNVKVGFSEPREHQYAKTMNYRGRKSARRGDMRYGKRSYYKITNEMIANVLNYGAPEANQPARPWLGGSPVAQRARKAATASLSAATGSAPQGAVEDAISQEFQAHLRKLIESTPQGDPSTWGAETQRILGSN